MASMPPWAGMSCRIGPQKATRTLYPRSRCAATAQMEQSRRYRLTMAAEVIPHPEKLEKGGEDAFFFSDYDGGVLAIADGVSGWAEENVDPALFSKELVQHIADSFSLEETCCEPRHLLSRAHELTTSVGAATAIVAILSSQEGVLRIASLGDCGIRILRGETIIFASAAQQHYFDCPYQLSSEPGGQTAEDAAVFNIKVEDGDTIVMGSDGLFDNAYDRDVVKTVNFFGALHEEPVKQTAQALAALANRNSRDAKYDSPYSKEAIFQGYDLPLWKKLLGQRMTGGKLDDITVLVAKVSRVQQEGESEMS